MSMTATIILNVCLWVGVVAALVWLLAHPGISKAREHEHGLLHFHRRRRKPEHPTAA